MIIWILSLSRLSRADLQGFEEVLLLQRSYSQLVLFLQMTGIQTGQEWPVWGWKLMFPEVFNNVFSMAQRNNSKQDIQQNTWDEPASLDVNQCYHTRFKILENVVWLLTWSQIKIPELISGKQVKLSFFRDEKPSWFSKLSGPQYPALPSNVNITRTPSFLRGCERRCSHTRSTSLCQLKLEKENNWGHVTVKICSYFYSADTKDRKIGVLMLCSHVLGASCCEKLVTLVMWLLTTM